LPATWPSTTIVWLIAAGLPRMFVPMRVEGCAVARGEGSHARGVGVELLLVEDGEVVGLDVAESYFVAHFSTPS